MIQANELRIGNWLNTRLNESGYVKIDQNHISIIADGNEYGYSAIPLTPEILDKAGFEGAANKNDDALVYQHPDNEILIDCNIMAVMLENDWGATIRADVKFVHQLQNIYFALTGTELEINLTEKIP